METALAAAKEGGSLFIIQSKEKRRAGRERRGASPQKREEKKKKPDKTHYEAAMKDELFKEATARFRRARSPRENGRFQPDKMFPIGVG